MKMSELFGQTLRKAPAGVQSEGLALLIRGGFLRQSSAGVFSFLPLGTRVIVKMREMLREVLGGQEVIVPGSLPADGTPGRAVEGKSPPAGGVGGGLVPTGAAEEQVAALARGEIGSFRHLPAFIYQYKSIRSDRDPSPSGLVRFRERLMLFGYALAEGEGELARQYEQHRGELEHFLARCRLPVKIAEADPPVAGISTAEDRAEAAGRAEATEYPAADGTSLSHQLVFFNPQGRQAYLVCDGCGYTAHREAAVFARAPGSGEAPGALEKVATPDATTMQALAEQLQVPLSKTAKAVFLMARTASGQSGTRETFVVAVLRGDMDLNEAKLEAVLNAVSMRPAVDEEIRRWGIEPGYGSPVGVKGIRLVVDEAIPRCGNLIAGANEEGCHLRNVNYGRDFEGGVVADIAWAAEGAPCLHCGKPLRLVRGSPVAAGSGRDAGVCEHAGVTFQDREGRNRPVRMGLHSLDLGRLLVCVAEQHHDENGLIWPQAIAPYHIHIVKLTKTDEVPLKIVEQLRAAGLDVLYDDREESAGVKFNDADLIGVPVRLTIGDRSLQAGGVELKLRGGEEKTLVPLEELESRVEELKQQL
jgi:prolyl-tRNA synthetase